jgi:hypothetical protein
VTYVPEWLVGVDQVVGQSNTCSARAGALGTLVRNRTVATVLSMGWPKLFATCLWLVSWRERRRRVPALDPGTAPAPARSGSRRTLLPSSTLIGWGRCSNAKGSAG